MVLLNRGFPVAAFSMLYMSPTVPMARGRPMPKAGASGLFALREHRPAGFQPRRRAR
jgi:hypothetical protein